MNRKLWCIGGGKGGVGKSIFTLGLGLCLSRLGRKIILMDLDLGGANLHTLMGVRYPALTLEDFFLKRVSRLEDLIIDTQIEGMGLICGADDILGAANPTYSQKIRALQQIVDLPADLVLLDLGAGTSFNILDFFNYSPGKLCILTNQTTSLQNVYGFIKSALYRHISREFPRDHDLLDLLQPLDPQNGNENLDSMEEIRAHLEDGERRARLDRLLQDFTVHLVVNMVKGPRDLQAPVIIQKVCESFLSIRPEVLGHITSDPEVEQAVNRMVPFPLGRQDSPAARDLGRIAALLLEKSGLASQVHAGVRARAAVDGSKPWHVHQSGASI
ncbi:MAG: MinD/ParA family protein [Deltaproteobacteria bacterium]|nr:MinD/ParA family protein [Deltaproteobacteria bacterium]